MSPPASPKREATAFAALTSSRASRIAIAARCVVTESLVCMPLAPLSLWMTMATVRCGAVVAIAAGFATRRRGWTRLELRLHASNGVGKYALTGVALNFLQVYAIAVGSKRHRYSGCTGATGATNTVYIIFGKLGQIKVNNV